MATIRKALIEEILILQQFFVKHSLNLNMPKMSSLKEFKPEKLLNEL